MAAPVGADVGDGFESVRDTVVDLVLVTILRQGMSKSSVSGGRAKSMRGVLTASEALLMHLVTTLT